jgi:hypothetical protein
MAIVTFSVLPEPPDDTAAAGEDAAALDAAGAALVEAAAAGVLATAAALDVVAPPALLLDEEQLARSMPATATRPTAAVRSDLCPTRDRPERTAAIVERPFSCPHREVRNQA